MLASVDIRQGIQVVLNIVNLVNAVPVTDGAVLVPLIAIANRKSIVDEKNLLKLHQLNSVHFFKNDFV
jgi:hypothetical protein